MNLLAHALLSPPEPQVLLGNVTADWIKGRARRTLPDRIQSGFDLHRQIDDFTDTHPLVLACANRFNRWDRYAPVLVDILFDHILATRWPAFSPIPLPAFIDQTYAALRPNIHLVPHRAQYALHALLADDWFRAYATLDGIALSLTRLSHRLRHYIELAPAVQDFLAHRSHFEEAFDAFFPQLQNHVASVPLHIANPTR